MAIDRDDELDLIKQVVGLEVMQGQNTLILKEIKDDLKALNLEYRNYRIDVSKRLEAVERNQEQLNRLDIEEKIKEINLRLGYIERFKTQLRTGWLVIAFVGYCVYTVFADDIKSLLHR